MMDEPTYGQGLEEGRDEIVDFIFDILADEREVCEGMGWTERLSLINRLEARIDAYIDDMRGVWNAH